MRDMKTRRHFLTVFGAAAVSTPGCVFDSESTDDNATNWSNESWADGSDFDGAERECVEKGPARAEGAPIAVTETESDTENLWCHEVAGTAALEKVGERLDFDGITEHSDFGVWYSEDWEKVYIKIWTNYPYDCPPLTFEEVKEAAPSEVTATISRENIEPSKCAHPVYVEQWNFNEDQGEGNETTS